MTTKKILSLLFGILFLITANFSFASAKSLNDLTSYQKQKYWSIWKTNCQQLLMNKDYKNYMTCSLNTFEEASNLQEKNAWCKDSDGADYSTKGIVKTDLRPEGIEDYTYTFSSGKTYLFEGACSADNQYFYYQKNCAELGDYEAKNGACVPKIIIIEKGLLHISPSTSSPLVKTVKKGTTNIHLLSINFDAVYEDILVKKMTLKFYVNDQLSYSMPVQKIYLIDGNGEQLGTSLVSPGGEIKFTFQNLSISSDKDRIVNVYADLVSPSGFAPGEYPSGNIHVTLSAKDMEAIGAGSGTVIIPDGEVTGPNITVTD